MFRKSMFGLICLSTAELFSPASIGGEQVVAPTENLIISDQMDAREREIIVRVKENVEARHKADKQKSSLWKPPFNYVYLPSAPQNAHAILVGVVERDFIDQGYIITTYCERPGSKMMRQRARVCRDYHGWQTKHRGVFSFQGIDPQ
jgi:hypothetical protein